MNEQEIAAALEQDAAADTGEAEAPAAADKGNAPADGVGAAAPEDGARPPAPEERPAMRGDGALRPLTEEQRRTIVGEQLRRIGELDPTVRSLEDLTRADNFETFYALVRKGNSLVDAFKLANFERLTRRALEAERQRYRNRIAGLRHIGTPTGRGGLGRPVPADVAEQYRVLNPGVSDEEIARHYNRNHK